MSRPCSVFANRAVRRFLRISLRSMLVVVTCLVLFLGIFTERANRQRTAVAEIERLGGAVTYDVYMRGVTDEWSVLDSRPFQILPMDFRYTVEEVAIHRFEVDFVSGDDGDLDEMIEYLRRLPELRRLVLWENHRELEPMFRRELPGIEFHYINEWVVG